MPPQEPLLPQETDDFELSLKLTRMELERDRYKRNIENKERQLKEYEEEIITLRTQLSKRRGGEGIQLSIDHDKENEALLNQVEELKNGIEMRKQQIEELEEKVKVQREEAKRRKDEAAQLEAQREEHQEEVIKAQVEERVREEVDQHIRDVRKANTQLAIQQAEEHKKATAARLKEKEEELKRHYEDILAAKEKELEETKKQLQQKENNEQAVRDELGKLQEKVNHYSHHLHYMSLLVY